MFVLVEVKNDKNATTATAASAITTATMCCIDVCVVVVAVVVAVEPRFFRAADVAVVADVVYSNKEKRMASFGQT